MEYTGTKANEIRGEMYRNQASLLAAAGQGDFRSMHELLSVVIDGVAIIPDIVKELMLSIERHVSDEGFDVSEAGAVLERVLTSGSSRNAACGGERPAMRAVWNPALRAIDAHYALRVLAEHPEFGRAGYTPDRIMRLADEFNSEIPSGGYAISGSVTVARKELEDVVYKSGDETVTKKELIDIVYNIDIGTRRVTRTRLEKNAA